MKDSATATKIRFVALHGKHNSAKLGDGFDAYSNHWFYNIFLLIESCIIFFLFFLILKPFSFSRKLIFGAGLMFVLSWVLVNVVLRKFYTLDSFNNGLSTVIIIILALLYYYYQLKKTDTLFIYAHPAFWLITAILMYKAGTFFLFLYFNSIEQDDLVNFYYINVVFLVIRNILLAIGFIVYDTPEKKRKLKFNRPQ